MLQFCECPSRKQGLFSCIVKNEHLNCRRRSTNKYIYSTHYITIHIQNICKFISYARTVQYSSTSKTYTQYIRCTRKSISVEYYSTVCIGYIIYDYILYIYSYIYIYIYIYAKMHILII